ncbi:MAG: SOS response-associated peptidase [Verrucomicrobiota bacterium]
MCGRFTIHANKKKLAEAIKLHIPEEYEPDYNIGPGREILSLAQDEASEPAMKMMHWGLRTPQNFHTNARIETADTKPRFRDAWAEHRCLIPANGFYEWLNDGVRKQPHYIYPEDKELLFFAGLWFPSSAPEMPYHCVVLTTAASERIHPIHHRMPVCLPKNLHQPWLNQSLTKDDAHQAASVHSFAAHSVSTRVNSVRNNDSDLILEVNPRTDEQMQLF